MNSSTQQRCLWIFVVLLNVQLFVFLKSRNSWKGIREYSIYNDGMTKNQREGVNAEVGSDRELTTTAAAAAAAAATTPTAHSASRSVTAYERHLQRRHASTITENPHCIPDNLHAHYPLQCRENTRNATWDVPAATFSWMLMTYKAHRAPGKERTLFSGHRLYPRENANEARAQLSTTHACRYATLELWWDLAAAHNITRWVAHGGTAMGTYCHRSINPWDDDVDITVDSCDQLNQLFDTGRNVTEIHPDIPRSQYYHNRSYVMDGRLITDQLVLMKGTYRYFKLKMVDECRVMQRYDLGGIDIQCYDSHIPGNEREALRESGLERTLKNHDISLPVYHFGPTFIQMAPYPVLKDYVKLRYEKTAWCDFPYSTFTENESDKNRLRTQQVQKTITDFYQEVQLGQKKWCDFPHNALEEHLQDNPRASQIHEALSHWYTEPEQRYQKWLPQVGKISGQELTQQAVPNMDHVEVDNSIAPTSGCRIGAENSHNNNNNSKPILKILNFNAERGTHWDKFAEMVRTHPDLQQPDIIFLNEMDIGMARFECQSGTRDKRQKL